MEKEDQLYLEIKKGKKRYFTFGGKEERTESFNIEDITLVRIKERE